MKTIIFTLILIFSQNGFGQLSKVWDNADFEVVASVKSEYSFRENTSDAFKPTKINGVYAEMRTKTIKNDYFEGCETVTVSQPSK